MSTLRYQGMGTILTILIPLACGEVVNDEMEMLLGISALGSVLVPIWLLNGGILWAKRAKHPPARRWFWWSATVVSLFPLPLVVFLVGDFVDRYSYRDTGDFVIFGVAIFLLTANIVVSQLIRRRDGKPIVPPGNSALTQDAH